MCFKLQSHLCRRSRWFTASFSSTKLFKPAIVAYFWNLFLVLSQFHHSCQQERSRLGRLTNSFSRHPFFLSSYWQFPHVGEKVRRKARCLQYKTGEQAKNNTTHNKTKQPKKTPRKLCETLRCQKVPKPLSTTSRCFSKSHSNPK